MWRRRFASLSALLAEGLVGRAPAAAAPVEEDDKGKEEGVRSAMHEGEAQRLHSNSVAAR